MLDESGRQAVSCALPVDFVQIYQYVIHVTAHGSVYTLVLMSLDRYLAVVHPITSMTIRNVRNTSIALAVAWVVIVLSNAPMLTEFKVIIIIIIIITKPVGTKTLRK